MPNAIIPTMKAELKNEYLVWVEVTGLPQLSVTDFRWTNAQGDLIPIVGVLPNEANTLLIRPSEALDIKRVHFLEIPNHQLKSFCNHDGWFRETYSTKYLGIIFITIQLHFDYLRHALKKFVYIFIKTKTINKPTGITI